MPYGDCTAWLCVSQPGNEGLAPAIRMLETCRASHPQVTQADMLQVLFSPAPLRYISAEGMHTALRLQMKC